MWFYDMFMTPFTLEILTKILLAFVLSSIIGIEREMIHKPAGIKTHTLICIAATLVMALGMYLFEIYGEHTDPSRLPAQILTGIGFVGAGTIIRDGFSVKGITTAASLLVIACIGLAVGAGFYEGAIITTLIVFLILFLTVPVQKFMYRKRKVVVFTLIADSSTQGLIGKIEKVFENANVKILNFKQIESSNSRYITLKFLVKCTDMKLRENLTQALCSISNIKEARTSKENIVNDTE